MYAEYTVIDNSSEGHFLEQFVAPLEERSWIIYILLEFHLALVPEAHTSINFDVLVGSPEQEHTFWVF